MSVQPNGSFEPSRQPILLRIAELTMFGSCPECHDSAGEVVSEDLHWLATFPARWILPGRSAGACPLRPVSANCPPRADVSNYLYQF